jgi:hypothetical protein
MGVGNEYFFFGFLVEGFWSWSWMILYYPAALFGLAAQTVANGLERILKLWNRGRHEKIEMSAPILPCLQLNDFGPADSSARRRSPAP